MDKINQIAHILDRRLLQHAMPQIKYVARAIGGGVENFACAGGDGVAIC